MSHDIANRGEILLYSDEMAENLSMLYSKMRHSG